MSTEFIPSLEDFDLEEDIDVNFKEKGKEIKEDKEKNKTLSKEDPDNQEDFKDLEEETLNQEEDTEEVEDTNPYIAKINKLYQEGMLSVSPEELPEILGEYEEFGSEEQEKILVASLKKSIELQATIEEKAKEKGIQDLLESLDPVTRKGVEFSLSNPEPEELKDFYKGLIYESDIKNLDPSNLEDAEKILKIYYKDLNYDQNTIEEKISDLKSLNKLSKEATLVKPRLDEKAESIANKKLNEQKAILDFENSRKNGLIQKTTEILKTGNLDGIPLSREISSFLLAALVGDEYKIPIKGREVELNLAEAMILHHKYSPKGDLKKLMKALIFLHDEKEFDKFYKKKVVSTETNRLIKEHKLSSSTKTGMIQVPKTETKERIPIIL